MAQHARCCQSWYHPFFVQKTPSMRKFAIVSNPEGKMRNEMRREEKNKITKGNNITWIEERERESPVALFLPHIQTKDTQNIVSDLRRESWTKMVSRYFRLPSSLFIYSAHVIQQHGLNRRGVAVSRRRRLVLLHNRPAHRHASSRL